MLIFGVVNVSLDPLRQGGVVQAGFSIAFFFVCFFMRMIELLTGGLGVYLGGSGTPR